MNYIVHVMNYMCEIMVIVARTRQLLFWQLF